MHASIREAVVRSMVAVALFLLAAGSPGAARIVNLKGRVLDKANQSGIAGASVTVVGSTLTVISDSAGRFTLAGTAGLYGRRAPALREPWFKAGALYVEAAAAGDAKVELFSVLGESLSTVTRRVPAGVTRLGPLADAGKDFMGFARITLDGKTWIKPALQASGPARLDWLGETRATALVKPASGNVEVTVDKLVPKVLAFADDSADLGDIMLDYPDRKLGVGALPIYGATVLFDGSQGRAAAIAELESKWQDWPRYTPSQAKFRIVRDPAFPTDTGKVTLQTCCDTVWGYDDIQAKVGRFEDAQIHVEFIGMGEYDNPFDKALPASDEGGGGKAYINSGVYVASRYEVQIMTFPADASKVPGIHDMGSLVDDYPPLSNQNRANGEWQAFDITFRGARFEGAAMVSQPFMSVWWNGVLVHDNRKVNGPAAGLSNHSGEEHKDPIVYGLKLQSEGRDVRYRNVWIKRLQLEQPQTNLGY